MTKGFGIKPTYKLVITTAMGGATDLAIPATSDKLARRQSGTILNVLVNPVAAVYQDRAISLGLEESLGVLRELGKQMAGDALVTEAHPEFVSKIAKRAALTKQGDRSVVAIDKLREMLPQIKPHHFIATLYAPNGRGLLQYSNLIELDKYEDWEKVR